MSTLRNIDAAIIEETKLTGYLLNPSHERGRHKAAFFARFGYTSANWQDFGHTLIEHARTNAVITSTMTPFGESC